MPISSVFKRGAAKAALAAATALTSVPALSTVVMQGQVGIRFSDTAFSFDAPAGTSTCRDFTDILCGPANNALVAMTGQNGSIEINEQYNNTSHNLNLTSDSGLASAYAQAGANGLTYTASFGAISNQAGVGASAAVFASPTFDSYAGGGQRFMGGVAIGAGQTVYADVVQKFIFRTDETGALSGSNNITFKTRLGGGDGLYNEYNILFAPNFDYYLELPPGLNCAVTQGVGLMDVMCSERFALTNNSNVTLYAPFSVESSLNVRANEGVANSTLGFIPQAPVFSVPEPETYGMMGLGLLVVGAAAARRRASGPQLGQ